MWLERRKYFIDQNDNFKTTCVSDITFAKAYEHKNGIKYFSDYKRLLDEEIDVLFVSLPNYLAAKVTISGLNRNFHVFVKNLLVLM